MQLWQFLSFCHATIILRDPNPSYIPVFSSRPFFQLFNNYDCCNLQLFGTEKLQGYIYNVLCGGVSFFYKTENDRKYMYRSLMKSAQGWCTLITAPFLVPLLSSMKVYPCLRFAVVHVRIHG